MKSPNLNFDEAARHFSVMANSGRLHILIALMGGEKTVTELSEIINTRSASTSQHLARLRLEGMVIGRRDGKEIYYSICDTRVVSLIAAAAEVIGE